MSTLIRSDGTVFLIQVYRDFVESGNGKRTRQSLRQLSEQQGRYVRIIPEASGRYEVALDRHVGFLLGESVARHFSSAGNIIYLESMQSTGKSLLVVVRKGRVLLDTLVDFDSVSNELLPFVAENADFTVHYSGFAGTAWFDSIPGVVDVPVLKKLFSSAKCLPFSLLDKLPADNDLRLIPCEKAIQSSAIAAVSAGYWLAAGLIVVALCVGYWGFSSRVVVESHVTKANLYPAYYQGISSQSGEQVIGHVLDTLSSLSLTPSLDLRRIDFDKNHLTLELDKRPFQMTGLAAWAKAHDFRLKIGANKTLLTKGIHLSSGLYTDRKIYPINSIYIFLSDNLNKIHPGAELISRGVQAHSHWKTMACDWEVSGITVVDLSWLKKLLRDSPVSCDRISLVNHDGVMRGRIHLTIWGR